MSFFSCRIKIILFLFLVFLNQLLIADPLYLNSANPFPLFSSAGRYDLLTRKARAESRKFLNKEDTCDEEFSDSEIFHMSLMPYFQTANSGTDYKGNDTVQYYNSNNQLIVSINGLSNQGEWMMEKEAGIGSQGDAPILSSTVPMPIGAIPEPFNFFALFYPWSSNDSTETWLYKTSDTGKSEEENSPATPLGNTYGNLVSKVIARYLGYNNVPAFFPTASGGSSSALLTTEPGGPIYDPLFFDYSNYHNPYFYIAAYPQARDPQKLFGYGYYNMDYSKMGVRSLIELKPGNEWGIKIYTGFSNIDIDKIRPLDTTLTNQGPVGSIMLSRYPDQINNANDDTINGGTGNPYNAPNTYSLVNYRKPVIDNEVSEILSNYVYDRSTIFSTMPDDFKTQYLQNLQNNLDSLGTILNQDFRPYHDQSFDDTTFEIFYRKMIFYNANGKNLLKSNIYNEDEYPPYILMPTLALHFTVPIAPAVPSNKIFAKPIANNGHWEYGANLGLEFDFLQTIVFGCDVGFSWYNSRNYCNVPVPTKQLEEGVFTYSANLIKQPGYSFTLGIGMQADRFLDKLSFFGEYRLVRHNKDSFVINNINPLLKSSLMENTHESSENNNVQVGTIFLNNDQKAPYPTSKNVYINNMQELSAWTVQMMNITLKYDIMEDASLGLVWQQPFSLKNAINASTIGISFEMYI